MSSRCCQLCGRRGASRLHFVEVLEDRLTLAIIPRSPEDPICIFCLYLLLGRLPVYPMPTPWPFGGL